jgi:hypothetical protein
MSEVIQYLRGAPHRRDEVDLTDGKLQECFVHDREQAALGVLVRRHGPMVWGVCRRVLGNDHDAEHVVVEEGERGVGLFEDVQGILLGLGDLLEEAAHVAGREVPRVAFAVEQDESAIRSAGPSWPKWARVAWRTRSSSRGG